MSGNLEEISINYTVIILYNPFRTSITYGQKLRCNRGGKRVYAGRSENSPVSGLLIASAVLLNSRLRVANTMHIVAADAVSRRDKYQSRAFPDMGVIR